MNEATADCELRIRGVGAVTAAGWTCGDFVEAVYRQKRMPATVCERPRDARSWDCQTLRVPTARPGTLPKSPRLRRATPISYFAIGAALEALRQAGYTEAAPPENLGIIFCAMNGSLSYTDRFYLEVLDDPALASPILFPETVFNAPASHIAHHLGITGPVSTLIGEPTTVMEAVLMASGWISMGRVSECLVIAAEECDWLSAEAANYYHRDLMASEGAAALLLSASGEGPRLHSLRGPFAYHSRAERGRQVARLVEGLAEPMLGLDKDGTVLIDDRTGIAKLDKQEATAWQPHWKGGTMSPKQFIGETLGAAGALQLVLGAAMVKKEQRSAIISMPGFNAAAYGCVVSP